VLFDIIMLIPLFCTCNSCEVYYYCVFIAASQRQLHSDSGTCYRSSSMVHLSVCLLVTIVYFARMAEVIEMPSWMMVWVAGESKIWGLWSP